MGKVLKAGKKLRNAAGAAFAVGGGVAKPALAVGQALLKIVRVVNALVKKIQLILTQLNRIESKLGGLYIKVDKAARIR